MGWTTRSATDCQDQKRPSSSRSQMRLRPLVSTLETQDHSLETTTLLPVKHLQLLADSNSMVSVFYGWSWGCGRVLTGFGLCVPPKQIGVDVRVGTRGVRVIRISVVTETRQYADNSCYASCWSRISDNVITGCYFLWWHITGCRCRHCWCHVWTCNIRCVSFNIPLLWCYCS